MKNEKLLSASQRCKPAAFAAQKFFILLSSFFILLFISCIDRNIVAPWVTVFDVSPEILASPRADTIIGLGTVREGEVVRYAAALRNTGTEPLVIKSINTSCGCTEVDYVKRPIAPGETGRFAVRFDSRGMWGTQLKLIEIYTSAGARSFNVLVEAEVENPEYDDFLQKPE